MANRYKLTVRALEDLGGIWNYTFDAWSEAQADKYYQQLLKQCQDVHFGNPDSEVLLRAVGLISA
jgi:toxin ParE1/3/4